MKRFACIALLVLLSLVCVAQGPDNQAAMLIKQAKEQCDKRQWNKALNTLSGIDDPKSIMKPSREQKAAIDSLRQVCRRGKAEDNILEVRDNGSMSAPYSESIRAAELRFNKEPYIVSAPFWCKAVIDGKSLVISIEENPVRTPRSGTVKLALKSNKNSTCSVSITQEARPQTVKTVVVTTTPDNALLTIENVQLYTPATFTLEQGPHTILIRKGGFSQVTKNINIPDDLKRDTLRLSFSLSSSFAYLHPEVVSEIDGSPLNSAAIEIDGYRIPSEEARLEGAEDNIRNFVRYNGGIIPVPFGSKPLKVRVSADRYETWEGSVDVPKGRTGLIPMQTIVLKPVLGNCKFVGNEDAYGATVFLNDKPAGVVDGSNISVQEGKYSVRVEKDGYMVTSDDGPAITVESGRDKRYNVSMARYGKYFITSDEPGAWVEIDDVRVANLPMSDTLKIPVGAGHKLNIGKNGYQTVRYTLDVEPGSYVMSVGLRKVYPLTIDAYKYKYKKASYGLWEKKAEGAELCLDNSFCIPSYTL